MNTHDYLTVAAQAFMTEPLPELGPWDVLGECGQDVWLVNNAWEPLAQMSGPELWGLIEDHSYSIKQLIEGESSDDWNDGGHWDMHPEHEVGDWIDQVANGDTRQSYLQWVNDLILASK